jgi:cell cycle checkpoint protein
VLELAIEDSSQRPADAAVKLVSLSCNGDLRSAINSLQLLCTGRTLQTLKKRKTGKEERRGRATGKGSRGGRGGRVDVSEEVRAA